MKRAKFDHMCCILVGPVLIYEIHNHRLDLLSRFSNPREIQVLLLLERPRLPQLLLVVQRVEKQWKLSRGTVQVKQLLFCCGRSGQVFWNNWTLFSFGWWLIRPLQHTRVTSPSFGNNLSLQLNRSLEPLHSLVSQRRLSSPVCARIIVWTLASFRCEEISSRIQS